MPLTRQDALRLLRFCLGPDDSGSVELADDGAALVTISPAEPSIGVRTFEAPTFEAALRQAADARLLKAACVEKQIVFLEMGASKMPAETLPTPAPTRRSRPDLFPKLLAATANLLHETQAERGMSAIFAASSGRIFKRELGRQRERVDARRERFNSVRRAAIDDGRRGPVAIVDSYTQANAELLGVGDGALVSYASGDNRPSALACVVLLYAKEKTGIERARIGAAIAARSVSDEDRRALAALTAARTSYLHVFSATAPRPAELLMERALASTTYADLTRLEDMLLSGRETELGIDARAWFSVISHEMDHMGEIGTAALGLVGGEI
jgi:hypothetical protein